MPPSSRLRATPPDEERPFADCPILAARFLAGVFATLTLNDFNNVTSPSTAGGRTRANRTRTPDST